MYRPKKRCSVGLYAGDVSKNTSGQVIDLLIVSAFKGDYSPSENSVIGSLTRAGIGFEALKDQAVIIDKDYWLSSPLPSQLAEKTGAARILCYEGSHHNPIDSLRTMFSALFVAQTHNNLDVSTLAMPILCSGDQNADPHRMLGKILIAIRRSFDLGLSLRDVRIVTLPSHALEYAKTFDEVNSDYDPFTLDNPPIEHDMFISYSWKDMSVIDKVCKHLEDRFSKELRLFRDKDGGLNPGDIIPDKLSHAIRASRCVMPFYSRNYFLSGACNMEFTTALSQIRWAPESFQLRPILIGDGDDITGDFGRVFWEDASGDEDLACLKAEGIARRLIKQTDHGAS